MLSVDSSSNQHQRSEKMCLEPNHPRKDLLLAAHLLLVHQLRLQEVHLAKLQLSARQHLQRQVVRLVAPQLSVNLHRRASHSAAQQHHPLSDPLPRNNLLLLVALLLLAPPPAPTPQLQLQGQEEARLGPQLHQVPLVAQLQPLAGLLSVVQQARLAELQRQQQVVLR